MEILQDTSDLYIEVTSENFKCSPNIVTKEAYLSDKWKTTKVYRLHPFPSGIYLIFDLHRNPHYQLPTTARLEFDELAKKKKIKVIDIDTHTCEFPQEIYHYADSSPAFTQHVQTHINNIDFNAIIELLDKEKRPCNRGNIAKNFGWQCMNFKFNQTLNIPGRSEITELDRSVMRIMTIVLQSSFSTRLDIMPFGTDKKRTMEFANQLYFFDTKDKKEDTSEIMNVFESITYAMTYLDDPSSILKNHIDRFNCTQTGFNNVFGIYRNMKHPQINDKRIRVVLLGYSRKSIPDYYKRLNKRNLFKQHLLSYMRFMGERLNLTLSNAIPYKLKPNIGDEFLHTLPFADKCAFYSIFASSIYDIMEKYRSEITLETIVELVLPIGWITTGSNYFIVLKKMEANGLSNKNLTIEIISELVSLGGSISSGVGQRLQPFCNFPMKKRSIYMSQQRVFDVIVKANNEKSYSLKDAMSSLTTIQYIGQMGAQHILGVLCLLKIIHDPKFIRNTSLLKNTTTEKRIKKHYALNSKLANILYAEIANEKFNGCTRIVENVVCEFFRDIKDPMLAFTEKTYKDSISKRISGTIRYPDTFHITQSLFIERNSKIYRFVYDNNGKESTTEMKNIDLPIDQYRLWHGTSMDETMIQVSTGKKKVSSVEKVITSKRETRASSKKRKMLNEDMQQKVESIFDTDEFINDSSYHIDQSNILRMIEKYNNKNIIEVFTYNNEWFDGSYLLIEQLKIIQELTQFTKKKKKNNRSKGKMTRTTIMNTNGVMLYTTSINGKHREYYLSSKNKNHYMTGFAKFEKKISNRNNDYVAYYDTKEDAIKAMHVYILSKYNLLKSAYFQNELSKVKNRAPYIALFEKSHHTQNLFIGLLSNIGSTSFLHFPVDEDDQISIPWQTFVLED